ncbi:MAG TPA: ABC transporter permease [Acidimicrobiia bacterium]|nr:putative nitrate/sulfonate/bicarbonate transporter inner rane protein [Acidimicrobiia bacterium]HYJ24540.1 ABC transporter permease [Acidimicrobiia bacterium]
MTDTVAESIQELDQAQVLRTAAGSRRRRYLAVLLGWLVFIGLWWLLSLWVDSEARLPSPGRVFQEIVIILQGDFWTQFWASIVRVVAGFLAAVLIGTPVGFFMGRSKYWGNFLQSPVIVAGSIPGLTYAVMAFVVFGISFWGPVLAVGLIAMPYVAINVAEGVRGVDRRLVEMSTAYGRNETQVFRHVTVPSVLPFVFAGVRLSFSLAWKVGTLTEVFGSSKGIGFQIRRNYQLFNMPGVIAWVLLFVLFMLLIERFILVRLERRLFRWRQWEREA